MTTKKKTLRRTMQVRGRWKRRRSLCQGCPELMKHLSCSPILGLRTLNQGASARSPVYRGRKAWREASMVVRRRGSPRPRDEEILMKELSELMAGALSLVKIQIRSRARARIQKSAEERVARAALLVENISEGHGKSRRSCASNSSHIKAKKPWG